MMMNDSAGRRNSVMKSLEWVMKSVLVTLAHGIVTLRSHFVPSAPNINQTKLKTALMCHTNREEERIKMMDWNVCAETVMDYNLPEIEKCMKDGMLCSMSEENIHQEQKRKKICCPFRAHISRPCSLPCRRVYLLRRFLQIRLLVPRALQVHHTREMYRLEAHGFG